MNLTHLPVLKDEVIDALGVTPGGRYIDATLGGGGHTALILERGGSVLGIDTDSAILEETKTKFRQMAYREGKDWTFVSGNFRDIGRIAEEHGFHQVNGMVFDLGISSFQLDTPDRGFSYRFTDAPLDARMDQSGGDTAAQLVNRLSEGELYDIFSTFGEEQRARPIAHALCIARRVAPVRTVGDLVGIITGIVPHEETRWGVLSRIFQGLRIAVNEELESLKQGLTGSAQLLVPGGRLVVISFHSLEDRIVKQFMRNGGWRLVTKRPVRPAPEEISGNRRARSAKLRVAERLLP